MISKFFVPLAALFLVPLQSGHANETICPQANRQPYHLQGYQFETTSGLDSKVAVPEPYKAAIRSCVQNTGKVGFTANWIIPRAKSWANPNGGWAVGEPIFVQSTQLVQLKSCLFYGHRGEHDFITFMGVDADKVRADDEAARGCRTVVSDPYPPAAPVWKQIVNFAYDVFKQFPSDMKLPNNSGLELNGKVGVERIGPTSYRSFFRYRVVPTPDSKGSAAQVRVRPNFSGPAEALLKDFFQKNPENIRLAAEGSVEFEVQNVEAARLQYVWYDVYASNLDMPVAGISVPVLVPLR